MTGPEATDAKTSPRGSATGWRFRLANTWARIARARVSLPAMRVAARSFVMRHLANENRHLFALTVLVGLVCGLAAVAFHLTIRAADLVRAHTSAKPMVRDQSSKLVSAPEPRSMLRAEEIMAPAAVVPIATSISELSAQLEEGPTRALVVRELDHAFAVVLPEYLTEFSGDENLERMLIASDVARPASSVDAGADLAAMSKTMAEHGSEVVVVLDATTAEPIGVVTKTTLAMAFFDWYISSTSMASAPLAS